eukprot:3828360-Rhodomonas_salina.2
MNESNGEKQQPEKRQSRLLRPKHVEEDRSRPGVEAPSSPCACTPTPPDPNRCASLAQASPGLQRVSLRMLRDLPVPVAQCAGRSQRSPR